MEHQCLFCNIINGKIPSYKVFEDNKFVAILDINPANPGHMVLIPKQHVASIMELSTEDTANLMLVARGLSLSLLEFGAKGINFLYGMGEAAGQRSPHAIMHIIPRNENDKVNLIWEPKNFSEDDLRNQQQKLQQLIYKSRQLQQNQSQQNQQFQQQPQQFQQQQNQQFQQPQQFQQQQQQSQIHSQPQQPHQMPQHSQPQQFQVKHQEIAREHQPQQFQPQQNQPQQHQQFQPQQNQQFQQPQQFQQQQHQQFQQQQHQQPQQFQQQNQQPQQQKEDSRKIFRRTGGYWD